MKSSQSEVPHPTTLLKLTRRFGPEVVEELNQALLKTAVEKRVLRSRWPRVDTAASSEAEVDVDPCAGAWIVLI